MHKTIKVYNKNVGMAQRILKVLTQWIRSINHKPYMQEIIHP